MEQEGQALKITTVTSSYSRRQNTGNYSSVDVFASYSAELEEGEDARTVSGQLREMAKRDCIDQIWADRASYSEDWPR